MVGHPLQHFHHVEGSVYLPGKHVLRKNSDWSLPTIVFFSAVACVRFSA
jgi:hypothetical protein